MTERRINLAELEDIARDARMDEWQWYGNTKTREVYLATQHGGRMFVMDFVRWGMSGAQPRFQIDERMVALGELGKQQHALGPEFEVPYRRDFVGIGHPDATHIAAFSPPVALALLERIRELEGALSTYLGSVDVGANRDRLVGVLTKGATL